MFRGPYMHSRLVLMLSGRHRRSLDHTPSPKDAIQMPTEHAKGTREHHGALEANVKNNYVSCTPAG